MQLRVMHVMCRLQKQEVRCPQSLSSASSEATLDSLAPRGSVAGGTEVRCPSKSVWGPGWAGDSDFTYEPWRTGIWARREMGMN